VIVIANSRLSFILSSVLMFLFLLLDKFAVVKRCLTVVLLISII